MPQNTYLVICLNNRDIAINSKRGDPIDPPPFNDRCFNIDSACGIPCADLGGTGIFVFNFYHLVAIINTLSAFNTYA